LKLKTLATLSTLFLLVALYSLSALKVAAQSHTHASRFIIEYYCGKGVASVAYVDMATHTLSVYPASFICKGFVIDARLLTSSLLEWLFRMYGGIKPGVYHPIIDLRTGLRLTCKIEALGSTQLAIPLLEAVALLVILGVFIAWSRRENFEIL